MEDNTLMYFSVIMAERPIQKLLKMDPLKGGKLTQFEGGINIPFMMKWKGKIPAGTRYEYPVSSADIFATSLLNAGGTCLKTASTME